MPMISLITPVYNGEKTFPRALTSVQNQTFRDFEWICVNDGSTDRSHEMLARAAGEDARIVVMTKQNGGVASARNMGLSCARGEYISFLDSDDYLEPNALDRLLTAARDTKADVVDCSFVYEYVGGGQASPGDPFPDGSIFEKKQFPQTVYKELLTSISLNHVWHMLYLRSVVSDLSFDQTYATAEDLLFNVHAFTRAKRFAYVGDRLFHYCIHPESLTGNALTWREKAACNRRVLRRIREKLPQWGMDTLRGRMMARLRMPAIALSKIKRILRGRTMRCGS